MKIADVARYLVGVALLFSLSACEKEHTADVDRAADFLVTRMLDTTSIDSMLNAPYESTSIDSLVNGWSTEDWVHFWERVEGKRADAAKAAAEAKKDSAQAAAEAQKDSADAAADD